MLSAKPAANAALSAIAMLATTDQVLADKLGVPRQAGPIALDMKLPPV